MLDAAASLVAVGGSAAATLAEVGRIAGYSRGIVTHHFGSRDNLLARLAADAQQRIAPPFGHPPGLERLISVVTTYMDRVTAGDIYTRAFLLLWAESMATSPQLREIFAERDAVFAAEIIHDLEAGRSAGTVSRNIDTVAVAVAVIGQVRGAALHLLAGTGQVGPARVRDSIVDGLIRGVSAPAGSDRRRDLYG